MANSADNVQANKAVTARRASLAGKSSSPGTLTQWADEDSNRYWEFVGNGETTGTELMGKVVDHEAQQEPESGLQHFSGDATFARSAATEILADGDANYDPDKPIAMGVVKEIPLKSLLGLVTPFLERYAASVRQNDGTTPGAADAATAGNTEQDQRKTLGLTHSVGLTLPIDF